MTVVRSRKKRLLKILAGACVVVAVLFLALPVWFPWVLRPVLAHFGIGYDSYARLGYTRFALTNVRGQLGNTRFTGKRVAGFLPPEWFWRRYARNPDEEPWLTVTGWALQFQRAEKPERVRTANSPDSAFAVAEQINDKLPIWRAWLPAAQLRDGKVQLGSNEVRIAAVDWQRGRLRATGRSLKPAQTFVLDCDFSGTPPFSVSLDAPSSGASTRLRLSRASDQWRAAGELNWQSNRVELEAGFGHNGWWPERARLKSERVQVPARLISLAGYDDPTGAFALEWAAGHFRLEASARAIPKAADMAFSPPLELSLLAHGDSGSVVLEKLRITSPMIEADLSAPIGLNRAGRLTTEAATLRVALDLAKLEGFSLSGKLDGQVRVKPASAGQPLAEFDLSGEELTGGGLAIARARLRGRLRWPTLILDSARMEFADGSALGGAGEIGLKSRQLSNATWHFQGPWARRFLPPGMSYSNLQATGQIRGSPGQWNHSGQLTADGFAAPHLNPGRLSAEWRGENLQFPEATLTLASGADTLDLAGAVRVGDAAAPSCDVNLTTLTLTRAGRTRWHLEKPCRVAVGGAPSAPGRSPTSRWQITVNGFAWVDQDRLLTLNGDVAWPQHGQVEVRGRDLSLADVAEFVNGTVDRALVNEIALKARWDGGPVEFKLSAKADLPTLQDETFSATVELTGDAGGMVAEPVIISAGGSEIVRAKGKVPLTLLAEPDKVRVQLNDNQPFDFQAATEPNQPFWDFVSQHFGVQVADPRVAAHLQGTLRAVQGTLLARASRLGGLTSTNRMKLPATEGLRLTAAFERDRIRLSEFAFDVEAQPVRITGELAIKPTFLLDYLSNGALPDWRKARARIEIADARIEPFARYLPKMLSPQGRLKVSLGVVPGGDLDGEVQIAGAATRPIAPLAPIRDIEATILFAGRRATISRFTGRMGGRELSLSGDFQLPESGEPQFDLRLRGDNVPLIYRPGLLLRSDFNFQIVQAPRQPALVSGDVTLRDGLYLQDLKALVPGGRAEALSRPPYFSVAEKPFADWKLNLKVHGDRFLRVRTPYFRGEVSADFQLKGNLAEPQALGEARVNSGLVKFPFGTLNVEQGRASLASDRPYEPQLFATATSRLYGYNIRMEMTGTPNAPYLSFSSTPPLTSEQILLMLAAGELPRDDLSFSRQKRMGNIAVYLGKDAIGRWFGSDASTDRLTVRSGEDISQEGQSTYYLEYKLTENWSVVGEYDRFSAMNAGLKWRIFSR